MMDIVRPTKFCSQNIVFISFSDHGHTQKKRNNSYTEFGGGGGGAVYNNFLVIVPNYNSLYTTTGEISAIWLA